MLTEDGFLTEPNADYRKPAHFGHSRVGNPRMAGRQVRCPRCYHVNRANRNGKLFQCKACGYTLNADLVGARNIERRTREFRYMRDSLGCCQPAERPFEGQAPSVRAG